jgi:hypothetical protein
MNYTDFQALPVISAGNIPIDTQIAALTTGDYFLFESQEWQKGDYGVNPSQRGEGTELRHKVHYQRKVAAPTTRSNGNVKDYDAYGVSNPSSGVLYVSEYDLLESDGRTAETRAAVRVGKDKLEQTGADWDTSTFPETLRTDQSGDNYQDGPNASRDDDAAHDVINGGGKWTI